MDRYPERPALPEIVIVGAGGHASVASDVASELGYCVVGFYDDNTDQWKGAGTPTYRGKIEMAWKRSRPVRIRSVSSGGTCDRRALLQRARDSGSSRGTDDEIDFDVDDEVWFCAIGDNDARERVVTEISAKVPGVRWATLKHPRAHVGHNVTIGEGTLLCANAVVQVNCVIGKHAIVNTSATVDHDCTVANFAHVAPGVHLCGGVSVGAGTLIGVGSSVVPRATVGSRCLVGANSTVLGDVPDGCKRYGLVRRTERPQPTALVADRPRLLERFLCACSCFCGTAEPQITHRHYVPP